MHSHSKRVACSARVVAFEESAKAGRASSMQLVRIYGPYPAQSSGMLHVRRRKKSPTAINALRFMQVRGA
jgi:hypothetical protein